MNGRVYDYNLGRFLSVDPFIQAPGNSQSMNPYSYIMNNPLSGTDPSGYAGIVAASFDCAIYNCGSILSGNGATKRSVEVDNGKEEAKGISLVLPNKTEKIMGENENNIFGNLFTAQSGPIQYNTGATDNEEDLKSKRELYETTLNEFATYINPNIKVKISKESGEVIISGAYSGNSKFSADEYMSSVKRELENKDYTVDEMDYKIILDFRFINSRRHSDIDITSMRSLPDKEGNSTARSNAEHGGKLVNFHIYAKDRKGTATHEFLHILGFGDTYTNYEKGNSEAWKGHAKDIMGDSSNGSFQNYHMKVLIKRYGGK